MAKRWYVVHAYSGFEKQVQRSLMEHIERSGMDDQFGEVLVPTEEVVEMKKGVKRSSERKFFPGYVLVEMEMNEDTWHLVKDVPKVMGFIGGKKDQPALSARRKPRPFSTGSPRALTNRAQSVVRTGRNGSRDRRAVQRFQRNRRRNQLRKEPAARGGFNLWPVHAGGA